MVEKGFKGYTFRMPPPPGAPIEKAASKDTAFSNYSIKLSYPVIVSYEYVFKPPPIQLYPRQR
jgi:hypothetical protein